MHVAGKPKPAPELYALPGPAALSADNLSGHGISVLVLFRLFLDSLLQTIRINDGVCSFEDLDNELKKAKNRNKLSFIEVKCSIGARPDLGRPTTTALENKQNFVKYLSE